MSDAIASAASVRPRMTGLRWRAALIRGDGLPGPDDSAAVPGAACNEDSTGGRAADGLVRRRRNARAGRGAERRLATRSAAAGLEPAELAHGRPGLALGERRGDRFVVHVELVEKVLARAGHEHELATAIVHVPQLAHGALGAVLEHDAHPGEDRGLDGGAEVVVVVLHLLVAELPLDVLHL